MASFFILAKIKVRGTEHGLLYIFINLSFKTFFSMKSCIRPKKFLWKLERDFKSSHFSFDRLSTKLYNIYPLENFHKVSN